MRQNDWQQFHHATQKEIDDRIEDNNFSTVRKVNLPKVATVLLVVCRFKKNGRQTTGEIKSYKGRLNIDGSRKKIGVHYDHSYAPAASWNSIRLLSNMIAVHGWYTKRLDYMVVFLENQLK